MGERKERGVDIRNENDESYQRRHFFKLILAGMRDPVLVFLQLPLTVSIDGTHGKWNPFRSEQTFTNYLIK